MAEYIDRLAISKAYMDLCLAMGKQAKSRKGATFFPGDLLPETEPTTVALAWTRRTVRNEPAVLYPT